MVAAPMDASATEYYSAAGVVVMAYVVMAYVVMAYVVMAYAVMAYVVLLCRSLWVIPQYGVAVRISRFDASI